MRTAILAFLALGALASSAHATCIENRTDRAVHFVRGAPSQDMTEIYQDVVLPRSMSCQPIPARADGVIPLSVYVIDQRGKCKTASGCFYESGDALNVFAGPRAKGCKSFSISNCGG